MPGTIPTVINGVPCNEIVADFAEGIGDQGPFARKSYLCDWDKRYTLANGLLGLVTLTGGSSFRFRFPTAYPESANMYAREVDIRGVGLPTQGPKQLQWTYAIVAVNFGVPRYGINPGDDPFGQNSIDPDMPLLYATQEIDFAVEWITLKEGGLKLANGNPAPGDAGIQVPRADMNVTLHKFPLMPAGLILNTLQNPLNNARFLNCDAGFCRFNGGKTNRTVAADGAFTQDINYSFSYRPIAPWDQVFDPRSSSWQQLQYTSGGEVITRSNLSTLFTAPYLY